MYTASKIVPLILFLGSILLSYSEAAKMPHKKILILGAGLSGIIAGKTLKDNGVDDFLILEGQNYIGGRIRQGEIAGYKIERGANWIHFAKDEETAPIWKQKVKNNIQGIWSDYSSIIIRDKDGKNITDRDAYNHIAKVFQSVEDAQEATNELLSAREGLRRMGWDPKTPQEFALEYLEIDFENSKPAELTPFNGLFEKDVHGDFFMADQRGTWGLYTDLYEGFKEKIKLRTTVSGIKYGSPIIEVITSNGDVYTADHVLCTFSTGVLGSNFVTFNPPLPEWKKKAILNMPMSVYTKVFVKFPYKFWDDKEYILYAGETRDKYAVFQDLERPGIYPDNSGLILWTVTGDTGRRVEKQSNNDTKKEVHEILQGVYGKDIPYPTDILYPRWSLNPYTRGSYSEGTVNMTDATFERLGQSLGGLHFSGEATSLDWYGYMQGAYLTGEARAKKILGALSSSSSAVAA